LSYAAGAATMGNAGVDVKMPANIRDEIATVATSVASLGKLIDARRSSLNADFLTGWDGFKKEFETFAHNHRMWVQNMWYASYEKTVEYRKRLDDFRAKFEALTGTKVPFPSPGGTPEGLSDDGKGFPWKTLLWGGLIIGGLYGVSRFFSETRQLKRELVGDRTLAAPKGHVRNPPPWVRDPDVWEQARLAVEPFRDTYANPETVTIHVYKQLGGRQALS
jgi:hypothetical protein